MVISNKQKLASTDQTTASRNLAEPGRVNVLDSKHMGGKQAPVLHTEVHELDRDSSSPRLLSAFHSPSEEMLMSEIHHPPGRPHFLTQARGSLEEDELDASSRLVTEKINNYLGNALLKPAKNRLQLAVQARKSRLGLPAKRKTSKQAVTERNLRRESSRSTLI